MNRAAFLDRDGVINFDRGYVSRKSEFEFVPGVFEAARTLKRLGYELFVVTNQSGIGRGLYSTEDFRALDAWMHSRFLDEGAEIRATYYCPHHPSEAIGEFRRHCDCRKPMPGLLLQAAAEHSLAFDRSLLVGDKISDLLAARAAGIPVRLLVGTDGRALPPPPPDEGLATGRFRSLSAAAAALADIKETGINA